MSQIVDTTPREVDVAECVKAARQQRGWSGAQLASASGVSRAMIDRIERGASSPTALVLGKLSAALGLTISSLLSRPVDGPAAVVRDGERATWTDPSTGYRRRQVVATPAFPVDVTEVVLPPGATVSYPAGSFSFTRHLIWVLDGTLTFREGDAVHELAAGDRLILGAAADCDYRNESDRDCRYCVLVAPL